MQVGCSLSRFPCPLTAASSPGRARSPTAASSKHHHGGCGEWGKEPGKHVLLSTGWNAVGYVMGILIPAGKTGGCQGLFWACLAPLPSLDEAAEAWEGRQRGVWGAEGRGLRRGLPRAAAFCSISPTLMAVQRTG